MSSRDALKNRLQFYGGTTVESRLQRDKDVLSLRRSMFNSYQGATIELKDGRQFKGLINPNKLKGDYDNKILSLPFEDICLNKSIDGKKSQNIEQTGVKCGDTFKWVENGSHWIVFLQDLNQLAYFRSEIRRCDQQVEVNGTKYWTFIRGPVETTEVWNQKGGVEWNDLNYSLVMYITKDQNTLEFFHRQKILKIYDEAYKKNRNWKVVSQNPYYGDGIIQVYLDEYYDNPIADAEKEQQEKNQTTVTRTPTEIYIEGPTTVSAYSNATYKIHNATGGQWYAQYNTNSAALIGTGESITVEINERRGTLKMIYRRQGYADVTLTSTIKGM